MWKNCSVYFSSLIKIMKEGWTLARQFAIIENVRERERFDIISAAELNCARRKEEWIRTKIRTLSLQKKIRERDENPYTTRWRIAVRNGGERKSGFGENEGGERGRGKNHECVQRHSDAGRVSSQRHISWFET